MDKELKIKLLSEELVYLIHKADPSIFENFQTGDVHSVEPNNENGFMTSLTISLRRENLGLDKQ